MGDDNQEYLLPSAFAIKRRDAETLDMDFDILEHRVSHIEEQLVKRGTQH